MKSVGKYVMGVVAVFVGTTGAAMANACSPGQPCPLPEPSSIALVGVAIAGVLWIARKKK